MCQSLCNNGLAVLDAGDVTGNKQAVNAALAKPPCRRFALVGITARDRQARAALRDQRFGDGHAKALGAA